MPKLTRMSEVRPLIANALDLNLCIRYVLLPSHGRSMSEKFWKDEGPVSARVDTRLAYVVFLRVDPVRTPDRGEGLRARAGRVEDRLQRVVEYTIHLAGRGREAHEDGGIGEERDDGRDEEPGGGDVLPERAEDVGVRAAEGEADLLVRLAELPLLSAGAQRGRGGGSRRSRSRRRPWGPSCPPGRRPGRGARGGTCRAW